MRSSLASFIAVAALLVLFTGASPAFSFSGPKRVLVLNSYDAGFRWTNSIDEGIRSTFEKEGLPELRFEFMDTKHVSADAAYFRKLYELYRFKYRQARFDAIISSDDDALDFLVAYHDRLFPGVPVVFCGVSYFSEARLKGSRRFFTGVLEELDIGKTIDSALGLQPNIKQVVVINDRSATGQGNKKLVQARIPAYEAKYKGLRFSFLEDVTREELLVRVKRLPKDSIVLLLTFNQDRKGKRVSYDELVELVTEASPVPVYGVWDIFLGRGIVGGRLASGLDQGRIAAELAGRVLRGGAVGNIPVLLNSPNRYMFDYQRLRRFALPFSALPAGSIVINRPSTVYPVQKGVLWFGLFALALLAFFSAFLLFDVFRRKKTEEERLKAQRREHQFAALQESERLKNEFLSVISHELRTPLNSIMGFSSLLGDEAVGTLSQEQHQFIDRILEGADRMLGLINNLLDLARMQAGRFEFTFVCCPYSPLVERSVAFVEPLAKEKAIGIEMDVQVPEEVCLDGDRIVQVLINLLSNAIKFSPEKGMVFLKAWLEGDSLVTEVKDSGIGIASEDLPKLFVAFQQLDMSLTRKVGGTGLGLSISKRIVEAHGGRSEASSPGVGKGSTFRFTLPKRGPVAFQERI